MSAATSNVLLTCAHTVRYRPVPKVGDQLFCFRCNGWATAIKLGTNWHFKCTSCRTGRFYGEDRTSCFRAAVKHYHKHASHNVYVQETETSRPIVISSPQSVIEL